jgi:hypothetical protein
VVKKQVVKTKPYVTVSDTKPIVHNYIEDAPFIGNLPVTPDFVYEEEEEEPFDFFESTRRESRLLFGKE